MSAVQVFHIGREHNQTLVCVVDGDRIKAHSCTIRSMIATLPPQIMYRITLRGSSPAAFKHVVDCVHNIDNQTLLFIPIRNTGLTEAINIHKAISILRLEPAQTHVEGHINGYLSHRLVTVEELHAVQKAYGDSFEGTSSYKTWSTMVKKLAYDDVHGHLSDEKKTPLRAAAMQYPRLRDAINNHGRRLAKIKDAKQRAVEKRAARKAAAHAATLGMASICGEESEDIGEE